MSKKTIKLNFRKWRWYFKPSYWRWLRDCEEYMNSSEVRRQIEADVRLRNDIALGIFESMALSNKAPKRTMQVIWDEIINN